MPRKKIDDSFGAFFDAYSEAYGGRVARQDAEGAWKHLTVRDRRAALRGIVPYSERCRKQGVAMRYAQGYLNGRRWEDDVPETGPSPKPASPAGDSASVPERKKMGRW